MDRIKVRMRYQCFFCGVLILISILLAACGQDTPAVAQTPSGPLPGQQIWKQGASSFLFGTNDTYEWRPQNIQTRPDIQAQLRTAGFTLIRTFFPDKSSDSEIESRIRTIENSGAHCLGVITNIYNTSFDEHLIRYLGPRCQLYELGNESDYNNISSAQYLKQWNTLIPALRKLNPSAKFIGPATYTDQGNHGFMQAYLEGVKASGVLPDAVSFHWYPCWQDSRDACLSKANTYGQVAQGVRTLVKQVLGKDIPVGITEWNYSPGNPPPAYGDDPAFITQFTRTALESMAKAGVAFACQFDAASYSGYGRLDMFNNETGEAKSQYYAMKDMIKGYRPASDAPSATTATGTGLISRGKPVFCSDNNQGAKGPGAIVDGHYGNWAFWRNDLSALPGWCAINVGVGPSRLMLVWASDYSFDYTGDTGMGPQDYTIQVSADSTNGSDGNWKTVATIIGNHTRVREHSFAFAGQSWVKMVVTKGQAHASQPFLTIDEIDLHDVSRSLNDTFFFSGDSITGIAYNRADENQPSFAENVHAAYPQSFPAMLDGGLGGWNSGGAVQDIDSWLALNPDMHYWLLGWGTNDAFQMVSQVHYEANMRTVIQKIKQAGHIPILADIPAVNIPGVRGEQINQEIRSLNQVIARLTKSEGLTPGPDLYSLVQAHASAYLISDGIHPTPSGAIAMNKAWFEAIRSTVYPQ